VWRGARRRLRRLEEELASAKAERADLSRRLELFETIAAAAGAPEAGRPPSAPLPPALIAAAREPGVQDVPVRLDVGGAEVIAVVDSDGDPREWWTAIWQLASPEEARP
jgi:plasmid stabilization system protein ParE